MEDRGAKFIRLGGLLGLSFLLFLVSGIVILLLLRFLFGLLDSISWMDLVYACTMVIMPGVFFLTLYTVYFIRTGHHPSKAIRFISRLFFVVAICSWIYLLFTDIRTFFQKPDVQIADWDSYNLLILSSNGGLIFFTAIMQALTTGKEQDWIDKYRD